MVENVQGTVDKQFKRKRDVGCLLLRLSHQDIIKIRHHGNILFFSPGDIHIKFSDTPVNNGLLAGIEALAHTLLAQPEHELTFLPYHSLTVIQVKAPHVHV